MSDYLVEAILRLRPNSQFSFIEDDYSTIKWDVLEGNAPSQSEIDAAIKQIKVEEESKQANAIKIKNDLLARLGINEDELNLLLGK